MKGFGVDVDVELNRFMMTDAIKQRLFSLVQRHGLIVVRQQPRLSRAEQSSIFAGTHQLSSAILDVDVGFQWHADGIYLSAPPSFSSVHCADAIEGEATTLFSNGLALYEALPQDLQELADRAVVRYLRWQELPGSQLRTRKDGLRLAYDVPSPSSTERICAEHPLVRWVEDSEGRSRKSLSVVPAFVHSVRFVDGDELDAQASRDWVADVLSAAGLADVDTAWDKVLYSHAWEQGDVLAWDNRWVLHRNLPPARWMGIRLHHHPREIDGPARELELASAVRSSVDRFQLFGKEELLKQQLLFPGQGQVTAGRSYEIDCSAKS